ncbi:hypothetical protein [Shinella zoogloeoides]|uniref:hypothetical protein n=1 Tax=Shinella zoogloeoides TaxID=352475 RepID=UPI00273D9D65|nr:hypothetical protein [Shinella zoogloeoides]WLR91003.1 hypothetical protein Q9316_00210 [Shinella zoogloeoides]
MVQLLGSATSQEGYTQIVERLQRTMGDITVYEASAAVLNLDDNALDPEFNREALHALMGGRARKKKPQSALTEEG